MTMRVKIIQQERRPENRQCYIYTSYAYKQQWVLDISLKRTVQSTDLQRIQRIRTHEQQ